MKTKTRFSIISASGLVCGLAVIAATPAAAIEPPPEEASPPAALLRQEIPLRAPAQAAFPFMGVVTAEVPGMLVDHLGLSESPGIILRTICPDSPAEKAGLAVNDIITALDGDPVANPDAFSAAVRGHKPGDHLNLELIHKGKPEKIEVTLSERPADATAQLGAEPFPGKIPGVQPNGLRGLLEQNLGTLNPGDFTDPRFEDSFRQLRERMNRAFGNGTAPGSGGTIRFEQNTTIRLMDRDGSVEIDSSANDTRVKVRDRENNIVWSGPWNTREEKAAAPDDIRQRIDKVKAGGGTGFSFQFGKPGGDPDPTGN